MTSPDIKGKHLDTSTKTSRIIHHRE